jgi:hypothetical protein
MLIDTFICRWPYLPLGHGEKLASVKEPRYVGKRRNE